MLKSCDVRRKKKAQAFVISSCKIFMKYKDVNFNSIYAITVSILKQIGGFIINSSSILDVISFKTLTQYTLKPRFNYNRGKLN